MHPSRGRKKKQASFFDLPAISALNKKRGTRKFSCESRDGIEMKIYLGTGCVPSHFNMKDFCEKYPQFDVYERTSLASASQHFVIMIMKMMSHTYTAVLQVWLGCNKIKWLKEIS